jgi:broad specificity phosphatase PhoE
MSLSIKPGIVLYFCRHRETQANVEKRFQGLGTDTQLTIKGREQSRALALLLMRDRPDLTPLSFRSSPLRRACVTMEIVLGVLGLPVDHFPADSRLQEINLGLWDGFTDSEARALDPVMFGGETTNGMYACLAARITPMSQSVRRAGRVSSAPTPSRFHMAPSPGSYAVCLPA